MIASVQGVVSHIGADSAVILVGGFGVSVRAPASTLSALHLGQQAELSTALIVREDSLTLFGFADPADRDAFLVLQTVSGIGPRLAQTMLSVLSADQIATAVAADDAATLTKVPGVGAKGAGRMVLELKGKLHASGGGVASATQPEAGSPDAVASSVIEALTGLGWQLKVAQSAVTGIQRDNEGEALRPADLLKLALRELGGKR